MAGLYSLVATRTDGETLTATKYNADHQNHIDNQDPEMMDDISPDAAGMQTTVDPGEVGTESLATTLAGELHRIRHQMKEMKTEFDDTIAQHYESLVRNQYRLVERAAKPTAAADTVFLYTKETAGKAEAYIEDEDGNEVQMTSAGGAASDIPVGFVAPYVGTAAPSGWLLADGTETNCTTYTGLFDVLKADVANWGLGTKTGDVTSDFATDDKLDLVAHGLADTDVVHLATTGTLPAGLAAGTKYYVVNKTTNDFEVSLTSGGAAVDITDDGTGTHSVYELFVIPDMRGRAPVGKDNMGGASANRITDTQADNLGQGSGAEDVALIAANFAHTHTVTHPSHSPAIFSGGALATGDDGSNSTSAVESLSASAHDNTQPYQTYNYIIKH